MPDPVLVDLNDLTSLDDAAERVGRAPVTLRDAVRRGRLVAAKVGKTWVTTHDLVAEYVATSREWRRPSRRHRAQQQEDDTE